MLLETIRCHDGELENLHGHARRMQQSRREVFGQSTPLALEEALSVPPECRAGTFRCRVLYNENGLQQVAFTAYALRPVRSLQLLEIQDFEYQHKYADRRILEAFREKVSADEPLLTRQGLLTDTTYHNLALTDGQAWYTPHQPLLAGTRRAALLAEGVLIRERLHRDDLRFFSHIRLFNAMIPWAEAPTLPLSAVQVL